MGYTKKRWHGANPRDHHIYHGNFLAAERHIWDPVTGERHPARLTEPLAPAPNERALSAPDSYPNNKPALAGTAFAAITVNDLDAATQWMADTLACEPSRTKTIPVR
jgi:hypothetical protein